MAGKPRIILASNNPPLNFTVAVYQFRGLALPIELGRPQVLKLVQAENPRPAM